MSSPTKQYTALLPAAGIGSRMQASVPKQYLCLGSKTILQTTLDTFLAHPLIKQVVLVLHPDDCWYQTLSVSQAHKVLCVVGGEQRADSVLAGLAKLAADEWVLVHDAARPCISHQDITKLIAQVEAAQQGAILAYPVKDTMKRGNAQQQIVNTVPREQLWHALTPQMFQAGSLRDNISSALSQGQTVTDEASAMEWAGYSVALVKGRSDNIKVTNPEDLALAQWYLSQQTDEEIT
ncbi:2-C-methyl-D-erythritol 4-phosphate cytidylyltransferase [Agarivorans sp.]|uniref:2-C-methyl-D-erythritol 4-phosphate cytidylyltransferase n=1 Tax=Agarivorans sp. TaxID=1872412 RepID=UPI003CFD55B5